MTFIKNTTFTNNYHIFNKYPIDSKSCMGYKAFIQFIG